MAHSRIVATLSYAGRFAQSLIAIRACGTSESVQGFALLITALQGQRNDRPSSWQAIHKAPLQYRKLP
jgi:hypothetical protein